MKLLDKILIPVIVSLVVGVLTGWASSTLTTERRFTGLEKDVVYIRDDVKNVRLDVKDIKMMVFDILKLQKEDN